MFSILHIHAVPNAKNTQVIGFHGDAIKIKVKSPPVDGKANDEIIEHLRKLLQLPKNSVRLVSGLQSRSKRIQIDGLTESEIKLKLGLQ